MAVVLSFVAGLSVDAQQGVDEDYRHLYREIFQIYKQGDFTRVLEMTEKAMKSAGSTPQLMRWKYDALVNLKRYDTALAFIDDAIKQNGEQEEFISARYNIFMLQGNLLEALKAAKHKEKIAKKKSPWDCMNIMDVYLRMRSKEEALDWLQEAVNRGFISYRLLAGKKYALLKNEKRLYDIIEMIKVSIGLGNRARNFQATLVSGKSINLMQFKGEVVLVMFWATWCNACHKDMPRIKEIYDQFKDKGFEIIGISLDSNKAEMNKYNSKYKLDWQQVFSGKGWNDPTVIRYGVNSLPSFWLVDKKGILRSFGLKGKELNTAVSTLLAEK